ncbi:Polygalacturonase inhibitor [Morus notabilis]|uniref:Polygalacturonase inhibitor n=1 Tax=Morus notabilis TaxID=981085 RepID=W9SID9_9ROSA|nr:polygalacturonase inhibitor [Morus notabilis]EXC30884.1 Polygalacturonase inhibitor [Morus notabilis]
METTVQPYMSILFLTLLNFSTFLHPSLSDDPFCNPEDKKTLLRFKKSFTNSQYILLSWDPITDCCNWNHVDCGDTNRITSLRFVGYNLSGQIPPQIGNLPFLETINFDNVPGLLGPIAPSIANLTKLRYLIITRTNVSGPIPEFIGSLKKIEFINLSYNRLTGQIPKSIGYLPKLGGLRLDYNTLTGSIPESFGDFKKEDFYLYMSHNKLSGKIPLSMEKKDFTYIDLSENRLEGDVVPLFRSKKKMELVDLSGNLLRFDLSKVEFPSSLVSLDLSENKVFGILPEQLTELTGLKSFNVSYNKLCGKIPVGGNLQKFGESAYFHNCCLCGSPLESCLSLAKILTFGLCLIECILSRYEPF